MKLLNKRLVSFLLALVMLLGMMPLTAFAMEEEHTHTYENGICTACGADHPNLANYKGKVISIMGDSISTFKGYIPVADGFNEEHPYTYPGRDVQSWDKTWWGLVINELDAKLGINDSWSGSRVHNYSTADNPGGNIGAKVCMPSITRISNLGANGTPDVILVYGGTNDGKFSPFGGFDPSLDYSQVDLDAVTWKTFEDAYVAMILRMQHYYPEARIIALLPTPVASWYTDEKLATMNSSIKEICDYFGIDYVDLPESGITLADLPDGLHPNATGMSYIADAVLEVLLNTPEEAGENIVHSITHNLNGTTASKGHYKGVSNNKSFEETLTGELECVSVTMNGVDITKSCYENGTICIQSVTGDVVITAKEHNYSSIVTDPTCTEQGYTTYTCECGDSYVDNYTDELGYFNATAETLADGEKLVLTELNVIKHNKSLIFSANVANLGDGLIRISHGHNSYGGNHLEITADKILVYATNSSTSVKEYSHGLDISGDIYVRLDAPRSKINITIITDSGTFKKTVAWNGCNGDISCSVDGTTLQNVDLRWFATGIKSDYWFFGDSWFNTTSSARWTSYLLDDGYLEVLLAAYPGMRAPAGLTQFRELLTLDTPKYAIWALGMNNGDRNGAVNESWLTCTEEFLSLCEQYGITPILCTIPTTPKVNNRLKNEWIKNSGYRYIDFDIAVVENYATGEWFDGMAASDLNHPATPGAQVLYPQVFADFPELASEDPATCTHKLYRLDARTGNCKNGGREEYYVCSLCGTSFKDAEATISTTTAEMLLPPISHTYENGICAVCGEACPPPVITQQPESVQQEVGKKFAITVKAEGEGLTYQWYVKESGAKAFKVSVNKTSSYAYTMQTYMHNRQVYCVITDAHGNSVQTETATITRPPQTLQILQQPQDAQQEIGRKFSISPKVQGDGLTYQWYVKESGAKAFKVSSNKTSAYAYAMQSYMNNRQVYCVITDQYGNSVTTDVATISLPPVELKILEQPTDVFNAKGEKFSIKPTVQGDGLTYQWYYKESYMKDFKPSSNKTSAYAYSMQSYMNNRQVYCVITDKYGNQVQTEVVTIHLEK